MNVVNTKVCIKCKTEKLVGCFSKNRNRKLGIGTYCRDCDNLRGPLYRKKNPDYQRNRDLNRCYDIDVVQYDWLKDSQNNKCVICLKENNAKKRLYVDHNHQTGKNRNLLCSSCNAGLGHFKENIEILKSAISYLRVHNGLK